MNDNQIIPIEDTDELHAIEQSRQLAVAGRAANQAASKHVFADYQSRKSENTRLKQEKDLELFERFLARTGLRISGMFTKPTAWRGITWGIVEAFKQDMLNMGYSISSINSALSTIRKYVELAVKAGAVPESDGRMVGLVRGFKPDEGRHVDELRASSGGKTRVGAKKAQSTKVARDVADLLKRQPDTPQGRRDTLLMCLLIDHGLRIGEVTLLTRKNFDLDDGSIQFFRPKVNKTQTHELTPDTRRAATAYLENDAPADGTIWRASRKGSGELLGPMSQVSLRRALTERVRQLGENAGIENLSPHDLRHFAATFEARKKTPIDRLVSMFGWSGPGMALRYIDESMVANEGTARIRKE